MKQRKKKNEKLTKKAKIIIALITIVLGITVYFLGAFLTKKYLDYKNEPLKEIDFSEMTKPQTIDGITFNKLLENYNNILKDKSLDTYSINSNKMKSTENLYTYTTNDITYIFQTNNNKLEIMTICYKNENDDTKELIKAAIKANNDNLTDNDISSMYDNVIKTRNNKEEKESKTSEYFQYGGLEISLKEILNNDKSIYQFRIGRITE